MRRTGSSARLWPAAALFGLLAALLIRALVPSGYMISQGANGGISITPCSVPAPVAPMPSLHHAGMDHGTMNHGAAGIHPGEEKDQSGDPAPGVKCPYTALLSPPLPGSAPLLPPAPAPEAGLAPARPAVSHAAALAAPPPPSTGPPASA